MKKTCVVLGLGLTGWSAVRYLHQHHNVVAMDDAANPPFAANAQALLGCDHVWLDGFQIEPCLTADFVVISPGISPFHQTFKTLAAAGVRLVTDVDLFFSAYRGQVIGVTGTNGKSTLVSLLAHVAQSFGTNVCAGGNLGEPCLDLLGYNADLTILELSSYQLAHSALLPLRLGVLLNLSQDHLAWHQDLQHYQNSKLKILVGAKHALLPRSLKPLYQSRPCARSEQMLHDFSGTIQHDSEHFKIIDSTNKTWLLPKNKVVLSLNLEVLEVLFRIAELENWPFATVIEAVQSFSGLKHRLQQLGTSDDVVWLNDSKATNGHAVLFACQQVEAMFSQQPVLILAGQAKGWSGIDYQSCLAKVKKIIVVQSDGGEYDSILEGHDFIPCDSVTQAVLAAQDYVRPGECVLFSPGGASFDQYQNFAARGDAFIDAVHRLT